MLILNELAKFVSSLTYEKLTPNSILLAKNCFFDTYGVIFMGSYEQSTLLLQDLFCENRSNNNGVPVIGTSYKLDPAAAAFLNAYAAHVNDYDDSCYAGMTHPSAVILPCLLALGQYTKASGKDMIVAFLAGWEVAGRLGLSLPKLMYEGWHCASLFGSIGAAAAAARLLQLNTEQTMHAISLVICQLGGIRQSNGTKGKPFTLAKASENAVTAALCAKAGHTGSLEILEGPQGFFNVYSKNSQDLTVFEEIGKPLIMDLMGVCVKKHPICSSAHAAVEAANVLIKNHDLDINLIKSIHCDTTEIVLQYLIYPNPQNEVEAQFSLPYLIATTIYHKEFNAKRDLNLETIKNPSIGKIMQKITWKGDKFLGPDKISETIFPEGAMLTIEMENGDKYSHLVCDPEGFPKTPMTKEVLIEKFIICVDGKIAMEKILDFAKLTFNLEQLADVNNWKLD